MVAALAACKDDNKKNTTANTPLNNAVNAQGSTFARLFKAPADSEPSAVQSGDAGAVSVTSEPNNLM